MRTFFLSKKLSLPFSLLLVGSLLVNAVVYACAVPDPVRMDSNHSSVSATGAQDSHCADQNTNHKRDEDFCKGVRHSMLSLKPSSSQDIQKLQLVTLELFVTTPVEPVLPRVLEDRHAIFHPVYAISLPVSFLVLRI